MSGAHRGQQGLLRVVSREVGLGGRSLALAPAGAGAGDNSALVPAGTALLGGEEPLLSIALDDDSCDRCLASGLCARAASSRRRYRCEGCGVAFCSAECRDAGRHTPAECRVFAAIDEAVGRLHPKNRWLRFVARAALTPHFVALLPEFCRHVEDEASCRPQAEELAELLGRCGCVEGGAPAAETVGRCWSALRCNALAIHDDERCGECTLGWGIYRTGALFNHSCAPNAEWHHRGARLHVRTLAPLPPGAAVSISYVDLGSGEGDDDEGGAKRREKLRRNYHFDCGCPRCQTELQERAEPEAGGLDPSLAFLSAGSDGEEKDRFGAYVAAAREKASALLRAHPPNASATALFLLKLALTLHRKLPPEALRAGQPAHALRCAALAWALPRLAVARGPCHPLCRGMARWQQQLALAEPGREVPAALHGVGNDGGWMRLGAAAPSMPPRPAASDSEPPAASEPDRERKRQKSEPS